MNKQDVAHTFNRWASPDHSYIVDYDGKEFKVTIEAVNVEKDDHQDWPIGDE